jgi:chromosome segregation ATPase
MEQTLKNVEEYVEKAEFEKKYYLNDIQMLADEKDKLQEELNTACDEADRLEVTKHLLQHEIRELNDALDKTIAKNIELENENEDLVNQLGFIIAEEKEGRRSYTLLQIAVSLLIFLYGMAYGQYFRC